MIRARTPLSARPGRSSCDTHVSGARCIRTARRNPRVIPFFTGYAVIVWWLACRYRRTWRSFAWVGAGAIFMAIVILGHIELGIATKGRIYVPVLQPILYAYGITVTGMGLYIACLPRRSEPGRYCHSCGYDLRGIALRAIPGVLTRVCPECGMNEPANTSRAKSSPAQQGQDPAESEHEDGEAEGEPASNETQRSFVDVSDHR